jgi:hypothetical protein
MVSLTGIEKDADNQKAMKAEEGRIIQKMLEAKSTGALLANGGAGNDGRRPRYECESLEEDNFVVADDAYGAGRKNAQLYMQHIVPKSQ